MDSTLYHLTAWGFVILSLACLVLVFSGLRIALGKTSMSRSAQKKIFRITSSTIGLWVALISVVALTGFFSDFSFFPPRMGLILIIPLITILVLTFSGQLKQILSVVPSRWLLYIQSFRVVVEVLIWLLFLAEAAPVQMTFEGRNYDILVGLTAPMVAYFCDKKKKWSTLVAVVWNIVGLSILLNIVTIAILSMPTPIRVFMNEPANTIVGYFPIIWLPGILVPIAYSMHFFSLRQLMAAKNGID